MGFNKVKKAVKPQEQRPDCVVDLSLLSDEPEGTITLRFREPKAPDLFTAGASDERFQADYPDLFQTPNLPTQIRLMAMCYKPEDGEEVDALAELVALLRSNQDVYLYVSNQFMTAYPSANIGATIDAKKKDLAQSRICS